MIRYQRIMNSLGDHRGQFADQPPVVLEFGCGLLDEWIDDLAAGGSRDQGYPGFVFPNGAIECIEFRIGDVRRIAEYEVETLVGKGRDQVAMDQLDAILYRMECDVALGDLQGLRGNIDRDDSAIGCMFRDSHGDATASGAYVGDLGHGGRFELSDSIDRFDDDMLGFAARDQARGIDLEWEGIELLFSDEVGDRLMGRASPDQFPKFAFDLLGRFLVELGVQIDALVPARVGEQYFGIEARGGRAAFLEVLTGPLQQALDSPWFGLRRAGSTHGRWWGHPLVVVVVAQHGAFVLHEGIGYGLQIACDDLIQFIKSQVDAMVGEAVLWEIIGTNSFASVPRSDEAHAFFGSFLPFGFAFGFVQACFQDTDRFGQVLVLALFILALDDDAGFEVGQADGGFGFVDVLAARAGGAEFIESVILRLKIDFDIFGFGHHGNGRRRGMNPALGFGFGNPLHSVSTAFELQRAVRAVSFDRENDFLEATPLADARVHDFDFPALGFRVAPVHLEKVSCEQGGFFATGSSADFENAAGSIGIFATDRQLEQLVPDLIPLGFDHRSFVGGHGLFVWVSGIEHRSQLAQVIP